MRIKERDPATGELKQGYTEISPQVDPVAVALAEALAGLYEENQALKSRIEALEGGAS